MKPVWTTPTARVAGLVLTAALLASCSNGPVAGVTETAGAPLDLLADQDWSHFAGAQVRPDGGVRISPLDRRIVKQKIQPGDTDPGQANPPVNLRGPRLQADGDFRVTATMDGVGDKAAHFQLYAATPVIYDEWRQEPASLRIGIANGRLQAAVWDGHSTKPRAVRSFGSGLTGTVTVEIRVGGPDFRLSANGEELGRIANSGIFDGPVWFGADAEPDGGWTLTALSARAEHGGSVSIVRAPTLGQPELPDSLRARAARTGRPIDMGTALASGPLLTDDGYRAMAGGQFSMLTPENEFKPQFTQPRPGVFTFAEGDTLVDFAQANNMKVHAHTLVWHEALPQWMREVRGADAVKQTMLEHINGVVVHFKGKVAEWDVVNEPMSDDPTDYTNGNQGLRAEQNPWFQALGEQYIDLAFRRAHEVDGKAKLFINEYGAEEDGDRWNALYALVKRLKDRGVPLHGIGFQNHEYSPNDRTDAETFRKHVKALADIGVEARVSEMDVPAAEDERNIQAEQFAGKLKVCREEPNCHSFSSWGFTDKYGSANGHDKEYPPQPVDALPWDAAMHPKPAYTTMLSTLTP
jgi:endo-1,4-beta-xylanase